MPQVTITTPVLLPDPGVVEFTLTGLPPELTQCQLEISGVRVELLRNYLAIWRNGPAEAVAGELKASFELIPPVRPGLHLLSLVRVRSPDGLEAAGPEAILGLPAYFRVSSDPAAGSVTETDVHSAQKAREEAIQSEMVTPAANGANAQIYSAYVFCAATLVHAEHHFEGFSIYPLQDALTEESLRLAMNAFFARHRLAITLQSDEALSAAYRSSTPAFVLALHRVCAMSHDDAVQYTITHAERIAIILGIERGQKPSVFGVLTQNGSGIRYGYMYPGYRGNMLRPLLDEFVSLRIEELIPKLGSSSWARLLTSNYAEATAEFDHGFQYLRFWSLLELIAKKHVSDRQHIFRPNGSQILLANRQAVVTRGARAKVYAHLIATGIPASNETFEDGTQVHFEGHQPAPAGLVEVVPLWELLGAMYVIRSSIAHTGEYVPDTAAIPGTDEARAARFYTSRSLYRNLGELARIAMHRELATIP